MAQLLPAPSPQPAPPQLSTPPKTPLELLLEEIEADNSIQEVYLIPMARVIAARLADGRA